MLWPPEDGRLCVSVLPYAYEVLDLGFEMSDLFVPTIYVPYGDITGAQAAAAVENVLAGDNAFNAWRRAVTSLPDRLGRQWRFEGGILVHDHPRRPEDCGETTSDWRPMPSARYGGGVL